MIIILSDERKINKDKNKDKAGLPGLTTTLGLVNNWRTKTAITDCGRHGLKLA